MKADNTTDNSRTVKVFTGSSWECELVRGLLESYDIKAMCMPGLIDACAARGLKNDSTVLVLEPDKEQALAIINSREDNGENNEETDS